MSLLPHSPAYPYCMIFLLGSSLLWSQITPSQAAEAHRAPDSISDNENIRESSGENASMPTDFIYLRSVKAGIRLRDKVDHVIYFYGLMFMHKQERQEMRDQDGGA